MLKHAQDFGSRAEKVDALPDAPPPPSLDKSLGDTAKDLMKMILQENDKVVVIEAGSQACR
jgi:hypothetical protein